MIPLNAFSPKMTSQIMYTSNVHSGYGIAKPAGFGCRIQSFE
jgi:hypothetical protein